MESIVVFDFGSQYCHLIANRIRRLGVFSRIVDPSISLSEVSDAKGFILSGGPASVYDERAPTLNPEILASGKPILGICYGHQLLMHLCGGDVRKAPTHEFGISLLSAKPVGLFEGVPSSSKVWMSHGDHVARLPDGFECIASTPDCPIAAVVDPKRRIFGLQFHPEVSHTENGMKIFDNFLRFCGCAREWDMSRFLQEKIVQIRRQAGSKNVFMLASGGVDSTVCLSLLVRALGPDRVRALHVDTGFMRQNESAQVLQALRAQGFEHLQVEDASDYFFEKLAGVTDPEQKRKIIGNAFLEVQRRVFDRLNLDEDEWLLGQGTIYPDTIESGGTKNAQIIKTHHNRVELVQRLLAQGKVIEPLDQLYKDEVRELGKKLGLPAELVERHPFPGPGLAIRMLCSDRSEKPVLSDVAARVQSIASAAGLESVVLPIKSVGVQGDNRTFAHPAVLSGPADWEALEHVSTRITNEVREINRVLWQCAGEVTTRTRPALLSRERTQLLAKADELVQDTLRGKGLYDSVWQFPVVLVPLGPGNKETIVLRPVCSTDAMTVQFARLPLAFVQDVSRQLMALDGIGCVLYDVTNKPPGTIEWE
ncbi:MAG: glutamine-hydrolyzing GMP synthase [Candidatus Diapherotrites archaeon]|nr:glutamine-hydrolyzing GMP synthase [Candidatus Diapherotrites archaeon]